MYEDLAKALRCKGLHYEDCEKQGCKYIKNGWCDYYRLNIEAADAIEELSKRVPVPPHGRLIDADALIIALETQDYSCAPDTLEEWTPMDMTEAEIADIRNAPTVIPEEGE